MSSPPDHPRDQSHDHLAGRPPSEFHPWRLLGAIGAVLLVLVGIAALVDFIALGW